MTDMRVWSFLTANNQKLQNIREKIAKKIEKHKRREMQNTEDTKHKERNARWKRQEALRKQGEADSIAEWRSNYLFRSKNAIELFKFIKETPKPGLLARARWWIGQLVPRRHWGIYTADGGRRIAVWTTWLGKTTKEVDVKMGY